MLFLVSLPFFYAYQAAGQDFIFGGFLFNPLDGNSYLAKIHQGWQGKWSFQLTYSPVASESAHLFLFYLMLGHLGRILALPLDWMFHLARLISTIVLLIALYGFIRNVFDNTHLRFLSFLLVSVGSGLGWVVLPFQIITSDFWVAEAYPFLSSYANPHFPLSLALLVWLLSVRSLCQQTRLIQLVFGAMLGLLLSLLSPFGVVLAGMILSLWVIWDWMEKAEDCGKSLKGLFARLFGLALGGGPMLFYYLWVVRTLPSFEIWNSQNLTPAPAIWDVILSLSPSLLLALVGIVIMIKEQKPLPEQVRILVIWLACGLVMLYSPIGLQRRFLLGLYIPTACLAVYTLGRKLADKPDLFRLTVIGLCVLSLPTNILLLLTGVNAAKSHAPQIYLSRSEYHALKWIATNTPMDTVILASPETSLSIPGWTGRRVVYGHPYETVNAEQNLTIVRKIFTGELDSPGQDSILSSINYVFWGPRERKLAKGNPFSSLKAVFENEQVIIYLWDNNGESGAKE